MTPENLPPEAEELTNLFLTIAGHQFFYGVKKWMGCFVINGLLLAEDYQPASKTTAKI